MAPLSVAFNEKSGFTFVTWYQGSGARFLIMYFSITFHFFTCWYSSTLFSSSLPLCFLRYQPAFICNALMITLPGNMVYSLFCFHISLPALQIVGSFDELFVCRSEKSVQKKSAALEPNLTGSKAEASDSSLRDLQWLNHKSLVHF